MSHIRTHTRLAIFLTLSLLLLLAVVNVSAGSDFPTMSSVNPPLLLSYSPIDGSLDSSGDPTIMRQRAVNVNMALLERADPGAAVILNLFDDANYVAILQTRSDTSNGFSWTGPIQGLELGSMVLVSGGGQVAANITGPGFFYQIRFAGNSVHEVRQIDQSAFPPEAEPEPVLISREALAAAEKQPSFDDGSVIDILVVYSDDARVAAGGTTAIENLIDLAVTETNASYTNSGINTSINLVHTEEVAYDESGDTCTDRTRLRETSDGILDDVHTLRDTHAADMVSLIVESDPDGCGCGYIMDTVSTAFESYAFQATKRTCATGNYSFGHEFGHIQSARHDWYVDDATNSPFSYNHGYSYAAGLWRTIMAYPYDCWDQGVNCARLQYWSNPSIDYGGVPMGVPAGTSTSCSSGDSNPDCDADNHQTLNTTAETVANFRESDPNVGPLEYVGFTVDDDLTGNSSGDGDGFAECGETIELYVDLMNFGTSDAHNVRAVLSTDDPYLTLLINDLSDYPDIAAGGTETNLNDYDISISPDIPPGHQAEINLAIQATAGGPWDDMFVFPVQCLSGQPVLLVDDDDNFPNSRMSYTFALANLGMPYDIWDTGQADVEPDAATLTDYQAVVWFSGDSYGSFAGPGSAAESALGSFLDAGGCFLISSQDYHYDRGLTPFMDDYLGVSSVTNDDGDFTSVTGAGSIFAGLGPYPLLYGFDDYSDILFPDATSEVAMIGENSNQAALSKQTSQYRTTYWGFPWEAATFAADREEMMGVFLDWCDVVIPDIYEPDDEASQASPIETGSPQTHNIYPANDQDWVTFELDALSAIILESSGSSGDTHLWLFDDSLTEIEFNDDSGQGSFSYIDRLCYTDPLPAGTYYAKVDESGNDDIIHEYSLSLLYGACIPHISVTPESFTFTLPVGNVGSELMSINNYGSVDLEWDITLTTGEADVVGEWEIYYDWGCNGAKSLTFINYYHDGTFMGSSGDGGTWTLDGSHIVWTFDAGPVYDGYVAGNEMAGTIDAGSGCWRGERVMGERQLAAGGAILWDMTHGSVNNYDPGGHYTDLVTHLNAQGYRVYTTTAGVENINLDIYDIIVVNLGSNFYSDYTTDEATTLKYYVSDGGGLLIMGDSQSNPNHRINAVASMFESECGVSDLDSDLLDNLETHLIMDGISLISYSNGGEIWAADDSRLVAFDSSGKGAAFATDYGKGRAVILGDVDLFTNGYIAAVGNEKFATNVFRWLSSSWLDASPLAGLTTMSSSSTVTLTVTANESPGLYHGAMAIHSNDQGPDLIIVPVELEILSNPEIAVTPPAIHSSLAAGDMTVHTLTLSNTGQLPLEWEILEDESTRAIAAQDIPWLSTDPITGTLPGGSSLDIDVTIDSSGYIPGEYFAQLQIVSNDLDTPTVTVPVTMEVTPVARYTWTKWVNGVLWTPGMSLTVETADSFEVVDVISTTVAAQLVEYWIPDQLTLTHYIIPPEIDTVHLESNSITVEIPGDINETITITRYFQVLPCTWTDSTLTDEFIPDVLSPEVRIVPVLKTAADLWITTSNNPTVLAGDIATITLDYGNNGGYENDVMIRSEFPPEAPLSSAVPTPDRSDLSGLWAEWDTGDLAHGAGGPISIEVTFDPSLVPSTTLEIWNYINDHTRTVVDQSAAAFHIEEPLIPAHLYFDPDYAEIPISSTLTVDVVVTDVIGLYGIYIDVSYDPTLLEVTDSDAAAPGVQIEPGYCPLPNIVIINSADNISGTVTYFVTSTSPTPACDGSGIVASITFHGIGEGTSPVQFDYWQLSNEAIEEIPATGSDMSITVLPEVLAAEFSAAPTSGDAPLYVAFTNLSTGSYSQCIWDFGDGGSSAECNPDHTYQVEGLYTVSLTISSGDAEDTETKIDYILVNPEPVVIDLDLEADQNQSGLPGETVWYFHTLTNTGNISDTYSQAASSSQGWNVIPSWPGFLGPGDSAAVIARVEIPVEAISGTMDTTVFTITSGTDSSVFDYVVDTTTVGRIIGVELEADGAQDGDPGQTITYSHSLTNTGNFTDTFHFSFVSSQGWDLYLPSPILLGPDQSAQIQVSVDIPADTLAGTVDTATIQAASEADPGVFEEVVDETTVNQIAGFILSPSAPQMAEPGSSVVYTHTLLNTGNGTDRFLLSVLSSEGWVVGVSEDPVLGPGESTVVEVTVLVPDGTPVGLIDTTTLTIASEFNAAVTGSEDDVTTVVAARHYLYLPFLRRP